MLLDLLLLAVGLTALISGGRALISGASALALRHGVAPLLVGLTVVAFGTSTPELVVNVAAAFRGATEIGFGNVVGSNIANIGLLLASAAVLSPLTIHRTMVIREIPMMILAGGAALVLAGGNFLGETEAGYTRGDGLMLLLLFCVFIYYTLGEALRHRDETEIPVPVIGESISPRMTWALIGGGLAALMVGGEMTVQGAVGVASAAGVPEALIGLTIIAVGTSLPELATTITAARRGQGDLAIGGIVGSNIYNITFVWGLSVTIEPSSVPPGGVIDLAVMATLSLFLLPLVVSQERLGRMQGSFLLLLYAAYIGWLVIRPG